MEYHKLDVCAIPQTEEPVFINEPWLIDSTKSQYSLRNRNPELQGDNIRVYVPLDLNKVAILRRLKKIVMQYGILTEKNETLFRTDVELLISQVEIYDQMICQRQQNEDNEHSDEAVEIVKRFVECLNNITIENAKLFPWETIDYLEEEYLGQVE